MELDSRSFVIKIALNLYSQGTKKIERSPQETCNFQHLWNETLVTADNEYVEIFSFGMLDIKL